jgi:hypothetical protein
VPKIDFAEVSRRTWRLAIALAVGGTFGAGLVANIPGMIGFAVGAAFSMLNFYLWHRTVSHVGTGGSSGNALSGMRFIVFVLAGYAILNYFEANVLAALAGCFVAVAAVLLEILLELIYGT